VNEPLHIVVFGLSITSSWGNGHATNYRGLVRALERRGHSVRFYERDAPWYAQHRDLPQELAASTVLYDSLDELRTHHAETVADADLVVVGSYVPDGAELARWARDVATRTLAFYDIDTPVTLAAVGAETCAYLDAELIPQFDLYLSFTGGPTLQRLEDELGARRAVAFYCFVDPDVYAPVAVEQRYDLGYLGTYSADRQPALERLLLEPARRLGGRRFIVGGPQYPDSIPWPANVERRDHVPPGEHARFYCAQRLTLNVTRADMVRAGYSPSVRLFEAAACGVPIVSDWWEGLDTLFDPETEILVAESTDAVVELISHLVPEQRAAIGAAARERVLAEHTADHRAAQLEELVVAVRHEAGARR
jgi:spore maturation protein CgeB